MKQRINLGAYGWRHPHWSGSFYPEDLPAEGDDDWRLTYYSNEFNTVLVPANYWQGSDCSNCETWLDSVPEDFQFFVECDASMLSSDSMVELTAALKQLKPQLSALVFVSPEQMPESIKRSFIELAVLLEVDVIDIAAGDIGLILTQDDLSDLRVSRVNVENFVTQINQAEVNPVEATIIIHHPKLQAGNLTKFRSVLEIMGF